MPPARRLIVGSSGGTSGFGTIRSLRERYADRVFVVAIDTNPRELVAATVLADAFVQVPLARSPHFPAALGNLAQSYPGTGYLPLHDDEIEIASRLVAEGRFPAGLSLIAPPHDVVRLCSDKWEMHRWLRVHGLPSPETALATPAALQAMRLPVVLKPREGTGGGNFRRIRGPEELREIDPSRWLLQETLEKPEASVEIFHSRNGEIFRCVSREYLERRPGGPSTKARLHDEPTLATIAQRLARELPMFGTFNFEAMHDSAGEWRIIDVNPRVNAGTRMCAVAGIDLGTANLADFWGEPVESMLPALDGEYYVVKQYEDFVTSRPK